MTLWFSDPFGRAVGPGTLSAFTLAAQPAAVRLDRRGFPRARKSTTWSSTSCNVREFNRDFAGHRAARLPAHLGVNVLELMPVTNVKEDVEWGYTPLGYFAPDERMAASRA